MTLPARWQFQAMPGDAMGTKRRPPASPKAKSATRAPVRSADRQLGARAAGAAAAGRGGGVPGAGNGPGGPAPGHGSPAMGPPPGGPGGGGGAHGAGRGAGRPGGRGGRRGGGDGADRGPLRGARAGAHVRAGGDQAGVPGEHEAVAPGRDRARDGQGPAVRTRAGRAGRGGGLTGKPD